MKIGIPKALYYYYFNDLFISYFKELGICVVISKDTDKEIIELGSKYAIDEMCMSMKIFFGHVAYLSNKCDYLFVPVVDNFGLKDQMCANFLSLYELVDVYFDTKLLDFKIDYLNKKTEKKGLISVGKKLGFNKKECLAAYKKALNMSNQKRYEKIVNNSLKLNSEKKKILLLGHSYNLYDEYIGKGIVRYLEKENIEVIYSDAFESEITNSLSKYLSRELYWKHCKENIGSIMLCQDKIDGIIFLTAFPCGLDSLTNELVMRKIEKPYLNLIIDDLDSFSGIETRLESFIDVINGDE